VPPVSYRQSSTRPQFNIRDALVFPPTAHTAPSISKPPAHLLTHKRQHLSPFLDTWRVMVLVDPSNLVRSGIRNRWIRWTRHRIMQVQSVRSIHVRGENGRLVRSACIRHRWIRWTRHRIMQVQSVRSIHIRGENGRLVRSGIRNRWIRWTRHTIMQVQSVTSIHIRGEIGRG